jgi:hypothetical protein
MESVVVYHGRTSGLLQADERLYFLHIPKTAGTSLRSNLESRFDVADILNSNPNRKAHPIQGATF